LIRLILDTGNKLRTVAYQADGRQEEHAATPADLHRMQVMLAGLDWTDAWPADRVLEAEAGQSHPVWFVLLMTTRLDDQTARQLVRLQSLGLLVWLVLIDEQPGDPGQTAALQLLTGHQVPQIVLSRREASGRQTDAEGKTHAPA